VRHRLLRFLQPREDRLRRTQSRLSRPQRPGQAASSRGRRMVSPQDDDFSLADRSSRSGWPRRMPPWRTRKPVARLEGRGAGDQGPAKGWRNRPPFEPLGFQSNLAILPTCSFESLQAISPEVFSGRTTWCDLRFRRFWREHLCAQKIGYGKFAIPYWAPSKLGVRRFCLTPILTL
jgi:hypothetical protein